MKLPPSTPLSRSAAASRSLGSVTTTLAAALALSFSPISIERAAALLPPPSLSVSTTTLVAEAELAKELSGALRGVADETKAGVAMALDGQINSIQGNIGKTDFQDRLAKFKSDVATVQASSRSALDSLASVDVSAPLSPLAETARGVRQAAADGTLREAPKAALGNFVAEVQAEATARIATNTDMAQKRIAANYKVDTSGLYENAAQIKKAGYALRDGTAEIARAATDTEAAKLAVARAASGTVDITSKVAADTIKIVASGAANTADVGNKIAARSTEVASKATIAANSVAESAQVAATVAAKAADSTTAQLQLAKAGSAELAQGALSGANNVPAIVARTTNEVAQGVAAKTAANSAQFAQAANERLALAQAEAARDWSAAAPKLADANAKLANAVNSVTISAPAFDVKAAAGGMPDLSGVVDGAKGVVQSASGQAKETLQSKQAEIQQNMQKTDFSERYDRLQKDLAAANAAAKKAIEY